MPNNSNLFYIQHSQRLSWFYSVYFVVYCWPTFPCLAPPSTLALTTRARLFVTRTSKSQRCFQLKNCWGSDPHIENFRTNSWRRRAKTVARRSFWRSPPALAPIGSSTARSRASRPTRSATCRTRVWPAVDTRRCRTTCANLMFQRWNIGLMTDGSGHGLVRQGQQTVARGERQAQQHDGLVWQLVWQSDDGVHDGMKHKTIDKLDWFSSDGGMFSGRLTDMMNTMHEHMNKLLNWGSSGSIEDDPFAVDVPAGMKQINKSIFPHESIPIFKWSKTNNRSWRWAIRTSWANRWFWSTCWPFRSRTIRWLQRHRWCNRRLLARPKSCSTGTSNRRSTTVPFCFLNQNLAFYNIWIWCWCRGGHAELSEPPHQPLFQHDPMDVVLGAHDEHDQHDLDLPGHPAHQVASQRLALRDRENYFN